MLEAKDFDLFGLLIHAVIRGCANGKMICLTAEQIQHFLNGNPNGRVAHRSKFNNRKDRLRREWSKNTGQPWPKDPRTGSNYDAHRLIESHRGGPNEWWNLTPARSDVHTLFHQSAESQALFWRH